MPDKIFKAIGFKSSYVSRTKNGHVMGAKKNNLFALFPMLNLKVKAKIEDDEIGCIICYDAENEGEATVTLGCTHTFHEACIKDWFT